MKYLSITIFSSLLSMVYLGGCKTLIKTVDHPIDPIKAKQLVTAESPVVSVNLWYVSFMTLIISLLLLFLWIFNWKKNQKRVADSD